MQSHPLIGQANNGAMNQVSGFASAGLNVDKPCQWYEAEKDAAPLRASKGRRAYFVDHSGKQ